MNGPERLLILLPTFEATSPVGGAILFARHATRRGVKVIAGALESGNHHHETVLGEIQDSGVSFTHFRCPGWRGLMHAHRVKHFVSKNRIDTVLSYCFRPDLINSVLPKDILRVSSRREPHAQWAIDYGLLGTLGSKVHLIALRKLDGVFALTNAMKDELIRNGVSPSSVYTVSNFIDVVRVRSLAVPYTASADPTSFNIGYFGLLTPRKRVDLMLHALGKLLVEDGRRKIRLHIAGDGRERNSLTRLARDLCLGSNVVFHGHLHNPIPLMKHMDLVVLTSLSEGLPRSLMEAMALGKICIAPQIPGMSELVVHGETGYLFNPGDADDLARKLNLVLDNYGQFSTDRIVQHIKAHFDVEVCGDRMLHWLGDLMQLRDTLNHKK